MPIPKTDTRMIAVIESTMRRQHGHTASGYVALLWPTGGSKPSWVTVSVVHDPLEGAIVNYVLWLGPPNNIDGGPYLTRTLTTSSTTGSVGTHSARTFTMFFTSQGHSSALPSLHPTNDSVEHMLDAQMLRWEGNILVMCSMEDARDFQNLNEHEKLMAQSCVACLVRGNLLQMELETQYAVNASDRETNIERVDRLPGRDGRFLTNTFSVYTVDQSCASVESQRVNQSVSSFGPNTPWFGNLLVLRHCALREEEHGMYEEGKLYPFEHIMDYDLTRVTFIVKRLIRGCKISV
ncbi:hypothetical protein B0H17DRAFT_1200660 [Mycena rosella]|uniref:Uncharacterized protein n=1 Tax=Mycena rosella TaxID=1033263 RepID=A0AAD7GI75_MYCRO|nr:hypothetical protein B0H17DRAFT_1200660 [Mycena rosella]